MKSTRLIKIKAVFPEIMAFRISPPIVMKNGFGHHIRKAEVARPAAAGKCYPTEKVLTFGVGCYLSHSC
ncbi:hypothetical protein [Bacillus sp. 2205SS5-2]|uniref:hypothetical protein n=1 Tax=Bacillus sp. 2205SS5-2 TaxID=3109031 RepID=UPI0030070C9F